MAMEKSPELDANYNLMPEENRSFTTRRSIYFALLGMLILLTAWFLFRTLIISSVKPGGLDGCVVDRHGNPAVAIVSVDDVSRGLFEDGCYFFAELSPGEHRFTISVDSVNAYTQSIEIISGQAINLGTIRLQP